MIASSVLCVLCFCRSQFRTGLLQGEKHAVYPILQYLFEKLPELKKRAYVARYLVKIEVPPDILVDVEVNDLYNRVWKLINFNSKHGLFCINSLLIHNI